jgi:hypothetical protein
MKLLQNFIEGSLSTFTTMLDPTPKQYHDFHSNSTDTTPTKHHATYH